MAEKSSLQQAREAAGLTVEQISAITNIRAGVIKDLENNSVELCGGVDSAVAVALAQRALGGQLDCFYVDTGLMRANETAEVVSSFLIFNF